MSACTAPIYVAQLHVDHRADYIAYVGHDLDAAKAAALPPGWADRRDVEEWLDGKVVRRWVWVQRVGGATWDEETVFDG